MKLYRFEETHYVDGECVVYKHSFDVIKETPKAYWINSLEGKKRLVMKKGTKRYATACSKEAIADFRARKNRQISILNAQAARAKRALAYVDDYLKHEEVDYDY